MCMGGFGLAGICTHTRGSYYKVYEYCMALDAGGHKKSRNNAGSNNLHNLNNKYRIYYAIVDRS